jgi:hypothetical protein
MPMSTATRRSSTNTNTATITPEVTARYPDNQFHFGAVVSVLDLAFGDG